MFDILQNYGSVCKGNCLLKTMLQRKLLERPQKEKKVGKIDLPERALKKP